MAYGILAYGNHTLPYVATICTSKATNIGMVQKKNLVAFAYRMHVFNQFKSSKGTTAAQQLVF